VRLSLSIPTFNREHFIAAAVEPFLKSGLAEIEAVVYDGASSDQTDKLLAKLAGEYDNFHFEIAETNGGVDADYVKAVENSNGEYCWLMSSDDAIDIDLLPELVSSLGEADIYLLDRVECDKNLVPIQRNTWLGESGLTDFNFSRKHEQIEYLNRAVSIGAIFSFAPCVIVRRKTWLDVKDAERFFGTGYSHAYRLLSMMTNGATLKHFNKPILKCRMDNESFTYSGLEKRFRVDCEGYLAIIEAAMSPEFQPLALKILRKEHRWYRLAKLRSFAGDEGWQRIRPLLLQVGYSQLLVNVASLLGRMDLVIRMAVTLRRMIVRKTFTIERGQWDK
jgi:abequosyltransferase